MSHTKLLNRLRHMTGDKWTDLGRYMDEWLLWSPAKDRPSCGETGNFRQPGDNTPLPRPVNLSFNSGPASISNLYRNHTSK